MNPGILRSLASQLAQQRFSVAQPVGLHIDVSKADRRFGRVRIERQHLFVFRLGVRKFLLPLMQQPRREMRFGILRCELGSFAVSLKRFVRLFTLEQMRQGEPGAGLPFFDMSCWLEASGGAQELLSLGIIGACEHQAQIKVGLKNIGLGSDRFPIRRNGFVAAGKAVQRESKIEPCLEIVGIFIERFFQQCFRAGEIVFLDGIFSLRDFRRRVIDAFLVMADGSMGLCKGESCRRSKR